ncbi:copper resistance CopC family protein [Marinicellulosiphila megalodicopiae]|uniref:copper resistance CopC family protein n=1 Tax=Marinicellulosiphila megalodicopiae TaxID=2724896 RepID=UPI003BB02F26
MKLITKSFLFSTALCLSTFAFSHAKLESSTPEKNSVIDVSPSTIGFNFNKPMRLIKVSLTDQNGETLKLKNLGKTFIETHKIMMDEINPEYYLVKWSSLGKDGHKMSGEFSFMYHAENMQHDEKLEAFYQSFIASTTAIPSTTTPKTTK